MGSSFKMATLLRGVTRHAIKSRPCLSSCRWQPQYWRHYTTTSGKDTDSLRILFCGTDSISAESLRALHEEWRTNRELVEAIDVVCMPPKRSGRGLKKLTPGEAMSTAEALGLPYHQIPTFTGWKPPEGYNLVIAVSFGLFVPPRILRGAKYGGLNVHPSWLPDLRGPAPTLHAMLRGDTHMGASLQTLHETTFDHGVILSQTPRPGIETGDVASLADVNRQMAAECARLLLAGLRRGDHVPPYVETAGVLREDGRTLQHAPKMTKADTRVDWAAWTAEDWRRRVRISRAVWTTVDVPGAGVRRRVIFHDACEVGEAEVTGRRGTISVYGSQPQKQEDGRVEEGEEERHTKIVSMDSGSGDVFIRLLDGETWIRCQKATVEGKPERAAAATLKDLVSVGEE